MTVDDHQAADRRARVEQREAIYQLAPFIGSPRTLNAVATINEVFTERGIALPLPDQGTVTDDTRYARGLAEQEPLYGNEIRDDLAGLPTTWSPPWCTASVTSASRAPWRRSA